MQALVPLGLCPNEVHLNPASGRSPAPRQTRAVYCVS
uniref:Ultraviolet resistance protein RulB n=1 Tax=Pseudomonas coronafaciens pv. garcae TaxID=251653 RepID=A0A1S6YAH2_9PSED|nr:Ultraviolet resistance protein RulB [Pseudomonas coronafaciens pv. garcae]